MKISLIFIIFATDIDKMIPCGARILIVILAVIFSLGDSFAQRRYSGATFSYGSAGLVYEHDVDSDSFWSMQLKIDAAIPFNVAAPFPGLTASFVWNLIFAEIKSAEGNVIRFFAGPGIFAGMDDDILRRPGIVFGLKGRVGGMCSFSRNLSLSISMAPVLGVHFTKEDGAVSMLPYRCGLLAGMIPEVGIKYAF